MQSVSSARLITAITVLLAVYRVLNSISIECHRRTQVDLGVQCKPQRTPHHCSIPGSATSIVHCHLLETNLTPSLLSLSRALLTMDADLQLAGRFCPVVVFDSNEQIRPTRLDEYAAAAALRHMDTGELLQQRLGTAGIDPQYLSRTNVFLQRPAEWRRMDGEDVADVPFYVKVDHNVLHRGQVCTTGFHNCVDNCVPLQRCTSILYMFFYPHDYGGLQLNGRRYGEHDADLEHVRVLVANDSIVRVHYAAHGFFEGRWVDAADVQYHDTEQRRPMVFVACNGHASYPRPGRYVRLFGIAPDRTDGRGRRWNVNALVEGYPPELLQYRCECMYIC